MEGLSTLGERLEITSKPSIVDTIRLKFRYDKPENHYFDQMIRQKELYTSFIAGSRFVWTNNAWRKEQQALGYYVPKYWIEQHFKYPEVTYFCFEASLPKLIAGENITALRNDQFEEVVKAIADFCKKVGIFIFTEQIKSAIPTLIAIGENINITRLCTSNNAIKSLKPFDYKTHCIHRTVDFSDQKHGGKEAIFSQANETTKAYDKKKELLNRAETVREKEIYELIQKGEFYIKGEFASEILRIEVTLKTPRKITSKFKPYLGKLEPTFENLFKEELWKHILKDEVETVFNHPLQRIIFLSLESQPFIDSFLDKHYHHIQTKDTIRGILASLQEQGLAETRQEYLKRYKSRQTWYNYLKRLKQLQEYFDWSELAQLDNVKVHNFILGHFGIETQTQQKLGLVFDTQLSKNVDMKQRNT